MCYTFRGFALVLICQCISAEKLRGATSRGLRVREDVARLGAALARSTPTAAALAFAQLRERDAKRAKSLQAFAERAREPFFAVPFTYGNDPLDGSMWHLGGDLQAGFDDDMMHAFFGKGASPERSHQPFDTFSALRDVVGWNESSETQASDGNMFRRVCRNGNCTEYRRECHNGKCTESSALANITQVHSVAPASNKSTPMFPVQHSRQRQQHGILDSFGTDMFFDDWHPRSIFDDIDEDFLLGRRHGQLESALSSIGDNNSASQAAWSESMETQMSNGTLYTKVCKNGTCKETTKKCANWECSDTGDAKKDTKHVF